jgi:membrane protein
MVAGAVLVMLLVILAMSAIHLVEDMLPTSGGIVHFLLQALAFAVAAATVMLLLAVIYRYGPDRPDAKWRWITPGSILATLVWLLATIGFGFYVANFGSYNATYGSLGAVIVFLTWLYLTAYIILLGAELNAVLEQEVAADAQAEGATEQGSPTPDGRAATTGPRPTGLPRKEPESLSFGGLAVRFGLAALMTALLGSSRRRGTGG